MTTRTLAVATQRSRGLTRTGLAALLIAYIPVNFTFGSVNVLADDIGADLAAGPAGQQLVLAAYTTAFAATLVIAGRIGDRIGRRRLLVIGMSGIVVFSALTAFGTTLATVVVLRVLLGVAAGLLTPQVLSTIQTTAEGARRTSGVMLFSAMSGVSTVLGQIVAGGLAAVLDAHTGWRAVQLATAAIALVGLIGIAVVPASRSEAALALDATGAAILGASLLLLVVPLTLGPTLAWPVWSIAALVAGAALLAVFWQQQRRAEDRGTLPVVPPSVLRITVVRRGLIMALLFFTTYGAFLYELSALAQARFGMGALGSALLVLGFGIAFVVVSVNVPAISRIIGAQTMTLAAIAQVIILAGIAVLAATGRDGFWPLQAGLIPLGVAQALMFGPVLQTVLSQAPRWAAGVASGLFTTVQQLGLTLGVALLGGLFWGVAGAGTMDGALVVAFVIHAACAAVFAVLSATITRRR